VQQDLQKAQVIIHHLIVAKPEAAAVVPGIAV